MVGELIGARWCSRRHTALAASPALGVVIAAVRTSMGSPASSGRGVGYVFPVLSHVNVELVALSPAGCHDVQGSRVVCSVT